MATAQDIERWEGFGGSVEEKTSGKRIIKTWIAPNGENGTTDRDRCRWPSRVFSSSHRTGAGKKLRSWKEAAAVMEADDTKENIGIHYEAALVLDCATAISCLNAVADLKGDDTLLAGSKRGQTSPAATDETAKKRAKKDEGKQTAAQISKPAAKRVTDTDSEQGAAAVSLVAAAEHHPAADAADGAEPMEEDQEGQPAGEEAADSDALDAAEAEVADVANKAADKPGRQAAKGKQYREKRISKGKKDLEITSERTADTEAEALAATTGQQSGRSRRWDGHTDSRQSCRHVSSLACK